MDNRDYIDMPSTEDIPWSYGQKADVADKQALFIDRLIDYKAIVKQASGPKAIATIIMRFLQDVGATSCVVPPGLDKDWLEAARNTGIRVKTDDPPLSKEELEKTHAVVTAAAYAMAETGTIALDHRADQGRRIISLLPDTHICIIRADQITTNVPEALALLEPSIRQGQPITWISGPSATSDIELVRVEGVHGPRNLCVIIIA